MLHGCRGRGWGQERPRPNKPSGEGATEVHVLLETQWQKLISHRNAGLRPERAQRTYQKRKDSAIGSEQKRCNDILKVLFNLSIDVEAPLQAVSAAGMLEQEGNVSNCTRRLW